MTEAIIILNTLVKNLRCNSTCKAKRIKTSPEVRFTGNQPGKCKAEA